MELRRARVEERAALANLALRSKGHWGYDASFLKACAEELTPDIEELKAGRLFVLEDGPHLLGFHGVESLTDRDAELAYLFVDPPFIGRGHGWRLIQHAFEVARGLGAQRLVVQGDPNARQFYRRAGGRLVGTKPSDSIPNRELPLFHFDVTLRPCDDT